MKPNINSVEVHPQLSNNGHPMDGALVGACSVWLTTNPWVESWPQEFTTLFYYEWHWMKLTIASVRPFREDESITMRKGIITSPHHSWNPSCHCHQGLLNLLSGIILHSIPSLHLLPLNPRVQNFHPIAIEWHNEDHHNLLHDGVLIANTFEGVRKLIIFLQLLKVGMTTFLNLSRMF